MSTPARSRSPSAMARAVAETAREHRPWCGGFLCRDDAGTWANMALGCAMRGERVTARDVDGPNLLHIITEKGRGYEPAEKDPVKYHAVGPFDPEMGVVSQPVAEPKPPTYTEVFGDWLCDMAEQDPSLLAITPAMREGSGMVAFHERFPERFFDVGIAEQHAVTLAAGMACENVHPVVAIYSTFLQRAYDQVIHDVCLQNLPVKLMIDRGGIVGDDGPDDVGPQRLHALHHRTIQGRQALTRQPDSGKYDRYLEELRNAPHAR